MKISLPYHDGMFEVDLPSLRRIKIVGREYPAPLGDVEGSLAAALAEPVGTVSLDALLPSSGGIAVLVSDLTRGAGAQKVLAPLLAFFEERGVGPDRLTVVCARGMHRAQTAGELESHLGGDIVRKWRVVEHDSMDHRSLVEVGTTPAGTPCLFNALVARSALVVALGQVSFHYFAGFGGARKLVLPGVAGEETILANHRLSLRSDPGAGISAGCRPGNLDGNPVHEDMLAGARMLEARLFAVNVVAGEGDGLAFINAGEIDASHRAACAYLSEHFLVHLDRLYRAVIVSAGGHPKDINLLQSHKALRNASYALDEGGLVLAAAACSEGVGSDSYLRAFDGGRHGVPDAVRRRYTLNSQTAVSTVELTDALSIYLKSMLSDEIAQRFGFCPWKEDYASYLLDGIADEDILVIANGSQFLPHAC